MYSNTVESKIAQLAQIIKHIKNNSIERNLEKVTY